MKSVHKNNDIEVLRAVAVAFTVLCHLVELIRWQGHWRFWLQKMDYWGGVDLFFCISGFVIAGSLLRQGRMRSFRDFASTFYIRRIFRIWPAALLWLCISLLATIFFNKSHIFGDFNSVLGDVTAAALQVANFYYMVCTGSCGKEDVYWSLSLEEQFYLVFPVLLFFMRRKHLRYLLALLIALQLPLHRPPASVLWYIRTDAICYGVLIAMLRYDGLHLRSAIDTDSARRIATLLAYLLIAAIAAISITPALWVNAGLLAAAAASLVWLASYDADIILPWRRCRPLLFWIGSRSYAIYLVHEPCFWAIREVITRTRFYPGTHPTDAFVIVYTAIGFILVAVASDLTYRLVETPLRKIGRRLAERYESRVDALAAH